jgi:hypothetical protein
LTYERINAVEGSGVDVFLQVVLAVNLLPQLGTAGR